ncbi:ABC-three component system middle component 6 [Photobacterium sp. MCCC 1A19761]|uniref:ABC-three component system middle component 6 n=1 Tax=Photobacterium sp. MCCC 1A19761 TaxID=3115000 RepID=UPI00307E6369
MIPIEGCDPKLNVLYIGGKILEEISGGGVDLDYLIKEMSKKYNVSTDHIILTLDWLFIISAINIKSNMVIINEA